MSDEGEWMAVDTTVWRTVQFFLDPDTGDTCEVKWRVINGSDELTCTCEVFAAWVFSDDPICPHLPWVEARMSWAGYLVPMDEAARDEIESKNLDVADPEVFRDLLRRYGKIEVL
jgi:hypothetical protein